MIDHRIVEMRFDNAKFESNVKDSAKSLEDLKKSLDLESSAKGLHALTIAGKMFSLQNISDQVDGLSKRFSTMGIIGMTALQNITTAAMHTGKVFLDSLTITPIKTGLSEYETKMNAIQTILSNTKANGTTLDDVNESLARLNTYSDKTIYNFGQMTDMVGKFAAKSGQLKSSEMIVMGMANLAAVSGVDNTRLQGALYQLSQMSETMTSMDWMSVDTAGMGTVKFKDDLLAMAKAMGTIDLGTLRDIQNGVKSFKETLKDGWLTKKVFTAVADKYALDKEMTEIAGQVTTFTKLVGVMRESVTSGWAQTWEAIVGNKEQSTKFFTSLSNSFADLIAPSTAARNAIATFWNVNGGRTAVIEGLISTVQMLQKVLQPIGEAFREIFPPATGQSLVDISIKFRDLMAAFSMSEQTVQNIKMTFKGLFALVHIGVKVFQAVTAGIWAFMKAIAPAGGGVFGVTSSLGELIVNLDSTITKLDIFNLTFSGIGAALGQVATTFKNAVGIICSGMAGLVAFIEPYALQFQASIAKMFGVFIDPSANEGLTAFEAFVNTCSILLDKLKTKFDGFSETLSTLKKNIVAAFKSVTLDQFLSIVKVGAGSTGLVMIAKGLYEFFSKGGNFLESLTGVLNGVKGALTAYQEELKAGALLKIAIAIGVLAVSLLVLSQIKVADLKPALAAMTVLFADLFGSMALFAKYGGAMAVATIVSLTSGMVLASGAIWILAQSLLTLSTIPWGDLLKGLVTIGLLTVAMVTLAEKLGENNGTLVKSSLGLNAFASAMYILVRVVKAMGEIPFEVLIKGVTGLLLVMGELMLFLRVVGDKSTFSASAGIGLMGVAAAIWVLYYAVEKFSTLKPDELEQGMISVGKILSGLAIFLMATKDVPNAMSTGTGLLIIAASLFIFGAAVKFLGNIPIPQLIIGLLAMGSALAVVAGALRLIPKDALLKSEALAVAAFSVLLLSKALVAMGAMTPEGVLKAIIALGGSMVILAEGLMAMTGALPGAIALGVASAALLLLAPALALMGALPIEVIGKALLGLAGVFAVFGIATVVLTPVIPLMLALAAAIGLLGIAIAIGGAGVAAFALGLGMLVALGPAGVDTFKKYIAMIPKLWIELTNGIIEVVKITLKALVDNAPKFAEGAITLIGEFMAALGRSLPKMMRQGADLGIGILNGIADTLPRFVEAGINLMITFVEGMAAGIRKNGTRLIFAVFDLMSAVVETIWATLLKADEKMREAGMQVVQGFINGIKSKFTEISKWAATMGETALTAIRDALGIHSPARETTVAGEQTGAGFVNGLKGSNAAIQSIVDKFIVSPVLSMVPKMEDIGVDSGDAISTGVGKGITKSSHKAKKSAEQMAKEAAEAAKKVYDASTAWIDDRKYYGQLTLNEELAAWKRVQAQHAEMSEERKKADREVFRVEKELSQATNAYSEKSIKIVADANAKKLELEKEYADRTAEINDQLKSDIKSVTDAYDSAVKSRTQELYTAFGLFDAVETKEPVDSQQLIDNLEGQVNAFADWERDINGLAGRGVADALIKELQNMGPQSAAQVKALNNMTDEQLSKYQSLWQEKSQSARERALGELEGLRNDSVNQIQQLRNEAAIELDAYQTEWATRMETLKTDTLKELETLKTEWVTKIGILTSESEKKVDSMAANMVASIKKPDWSALGQSVVDGIREGIKSKAEQLLDEVGALAQATMDRYASVQNSNSPSKEFAKLGRYAVEGVILGIQGYAGKASEASKKLGQGTIDAFSTAISNIASMLSENLDTAPVIRPVLDLTEIQNGVGQLDSLLAPKKAVGMANAMANTGKGIQNGSTEEAANASNQSSVQFNQYNYSPKALSRLDIYRQTKNQFSALKGVVSST